MVSDFIRMALADRLGREAAMAPVSMTYSVSFAVTLTHRNVLGLGTVPLVVPLVITMLSGSAGGCWRRWMGDDL